MIARLFDVDSPWTAHVITTADELLHGVCDDPWECHCGAHIEFFGEDEESRLMCAWTGRLLGGMPESQSKQGGG